jgi:transposase
LPRVAAVIARTFGVTYHSANVWKILRGEGWSCQKLERRAWERDEVAIQLWRAERWPPTGSTVTARGPVPSPAHL